MPLFLITFLLIYGIGHAYLIWRIRSAWKLPSVFNVLLVLWFFAMIFAPMAVRLFERGGHNIVAYYIAIAGYSWMGWIFLFCCVALPLELIRFFSQCADYFVKIPAFFRISPRRLVICCMFMATLAGLWGWFEAQDLRVEQISISSEKLPPGSPKIRIAQISDLHIGLIVDGERVKRVIDLVRDADPDLLVSTGDLVDGNLAHMDGVSAIFKTVFPALGMVAIPGNHEYYVGYQQSLAFTEKSGFKMLRSDAMPVGERLWLVGVDDPVGAQFGGFDMGEEKRLLSEAPKNRFVVMLKHRPEVDTDSIGRFDLQLSGHVHKGQIFPFNLLVKLKFPVDTGLTNLSGGGLLYVNRGAGTWGPPLRLMAPPEVTIIDIMPLR